MGIIVLEPVDWQSPSGFLSRPGQFQEFGRRIREVRFDIHCDAASPCPFGAAAKNGNLFRIRGIV